MCICDAPKHLQVIDTWLDVAPHLQWCHELDTLCRTAVEKVNCTIYGFGPVSLRQALAFQHASDYVKNGMNLPLRYVVMLWCIGSCELMNYPTLLVEVVERLRSVFSASI